MSDYKFYFEGLDIEEEVWLTSGQWCCLSLGEDRGLFWFQIIELEMSHQDAQKNYSQVKTCKSRFEDIRVDGNWSQEQMKLPRESIQGDQGSQTNTPKGH